MFDKLIESNSAAAEFKPRRKFFMMSSVVVGILFLSAVVFSLYAQDIGLGTESFDLVQIIAPTETDVPEPENPRQQPQRDTAETSSMLPNRKVLIAHINQPQQVPTEISTSPSTQPTIPDTGRYTNIPTAPNSEGIGGPEGSTARSGVGGLASAQPESAEAVELPEPPPVPKTEPKRAVIRTEGVINGKATYLPSPPYPAPARMIGASGIVNVQVTIDEEGKVISSKAITGHVLLRGTAESAAWKAKFSPTYLSRVPVKVTGVIVFNFKKS